VAGEHAKVHRLRIAFRMVGASVTRPATDLEDMVSRNARLGSPLVAVMQRTQASLGDHPTLCRRPSPSSRCLLVRSEVGSVLMAVGDILGEKSLQVALVQCNHVIKQVAATTFHPAFRDSVLPGALDRGLHAADLRGSNRRWGFPIHTSRRGQK